MDHLPPAAKSGHQPAVRRGLGRGLDALLPSAAAATEGVRRIEVGRIDPNPYQTRQNFDPQRLRELADSIKVHGIVQPIVVRQQNDRYTLIAGERRWRATSLAGLPTIPAIIREAPENQILELTLIENIQREELNPIETAVAFERLAREAGLTHEQIAQRTGKDRATVTNLLRLLKLPAEVCHWVATGELSMGHARALLSLATHVEQKALAERILAQGLSVRQTEALAKPSTPAKLKKLKIVKAPDANVRAAVQDMERALGTRIRLMGKPSRGKLVIEFYSQEDLDRIYEIIVEKK